MIILRLIVTMLLLNHINAAETTNNTAYLALLSKGFHKFEIKHNAIIEDVDVSIVCKSHGSAFRRCSVEIFSFSDGKLNSLLATTFNASAVKIKERNGMLDFTSFISGEVLLSINLKYIVLSNKILVDDSTK